MPIRLLDQFSRSYPPAAIFLIGLVGWLVLGLLVALLTPPLIRWLSRRARLEAEEIVIAIVRWPLVALIVLYGLLDAWRRADANLVEK